MQVGNHGIVFKGRHFSELATEIKSKLDGIQFVNAEFLRLFALRWANSEPKSVHDIREIKTKKDWSYFEEDDHFNFGEDKFIEFNGPFNLSLTFSERYVTFWNPPFRFWYWFEMEDLVHRNEWRKYMFQVLQAIGGTKVAYLADNSHPLEGYLDFEGNFEEMEAALKVEFGEPQQTFEGVVANFRSSYFIDRFEDIHWDWHEPLDEYLPEPLEVSDTDFDLKEYSNYQVLMKLNFDHEILLHKLEGEDYQFCHIAVYKGLLVVDKGIPNEKSELEVTLDPYAPFTYDSMVTSMETLGYRSDIINSYIVKIQLKGEYGPWMHVMHSFGKQLLWKGLGRDGGYLRNDKENVFIKYFYSVNEFWFLAHLKLNGEINGISKNIEIFRVEGDDEILIYKN